jgi:hypothetical protein
LSFSAANTAGNLLVVVVSSDTAGVTVTSVTDSLGNNYLKATDATTINGDHGTHSGIWYAVNCAPGTNAVTATQSGGNSTYIAIHEFSGIATNSAVDVTATLVANTAAPTVSATTTVPGALIFGAVRNCRSVLTPFAGLTKDEELSFNEFLTTEHKVAGAPGTNTIGGTTTIGGVWGAHIVAFKPAGGGVVVGGPFRTPTPPTNWGAQARVKPAVTGTTHNVSTSLQFQNALDTCGPGDVIKIAQGAQLTGAFVLRARVGAGQWVTIRTAASDATLDAVCAPGSRMNPANAASLNQPRLFTPGADASVITCEAGAQGYYFIGIGFAVGGQTRSMVRAGNTDMASGTEMAGRIVFDRCTFTGSTTYSCNRAIFMCGEYCAAFDGWIEDIFGNAESQSILIGGWQGPYYIDNMHLEGGTEVFMSGGFETSTPPDDARGVPSDLVFTHNYLTRDLQYRYNVPFANAIKNLFELKSMRRAEIAYNIMEHSWPGGQGVGVNLKSTDQAGQHPLQGTQDIHFHHNWIRYVPGGLSLAGGPDNGPNGVIPMNRVYIHDNLWEHVNTDSRFTGNDYVIQMLPGLKDITLEHETYVVASANGNTAFKVAGEAAGPIAVLNSILCMDGPYGLKHSDGGASGTFSWTKYLPNPDWRFWQNNVLVGMTDVSNYPQPSVARASDSSVGYANLGGRDYTVTGTLATYATDGGPAGVSNFAGLMTALAPVQNG